MKGARLASPPTSLGFSSVVKLFGNNFDLIKSTAIRSRSKVDDRPHCGSSSFNSYESIITNGFNKKYSLW